MTSSKTKNVRINNRIAVNIKNNKYIYIECVKGYFSAHNGALAYNDTT